MSKADQLGWMRWERSILDLFKTPEEIEADREAGWEGVKQLAKSKGW